MYSASQFNYEYIFFFYKLTDYEILNKYVNLKHNMPGTYTINIICYKQHVCEALELEDAQFI